MLSGGIRLDSVLAGIADDLGGVQAVSTLQRSSSWPKSDQRYLLYRNKQIDNSASYRKQDSRQFQLKSFRRKSRTR